MKDMMDQMPMPPMHRKMHKKEMKRHDVAMLKAHGHLKEVIKKEGRRPSPRGGNPY